MYYKIYIFLTLGCSKNSNVTQYFVFKFFTPNSLQNVVIVPLDPINSSMTSTTYYKIT